MRKRILYTDEEITYLQTTNETSYKIMAKHLDRSVEAVKIKRKSLNLSYKEANKKGGYTQNLWTKEELEILKKNGNSTISELQILFPNRSKPSLTNKRWQLGFRVAHQETWIDGLLVCIRCNKRKELSEFPSTKGKRDGLVCYSCKYKRRKKNKRNLETYLYNLAAVARAREKKEGKKCSLMYEDLKEQLASQNNKCFYTGVLLTFYTNEKSTDMSIDKVIPGLGYIKENIVLCTRDTNSRKNDSSLEYMKEWMPRWYEEAIKFLVKNNVDF